MFVRVLEVLLAVSHLVVLGQVHAYWVESKPSYASNRFGIMRFTSAVLIKLLAVEMVDFTLNEFVMSMRTCGMVLIDGPFHVVPACSNASRTGAWNHSC